MTVWNYLGESIDHDIEQQVQTDEIDDQEK